MKLFGEIIEEYMSALDISQRALAKELGINHAFLSRVRNGERSCPLDDLETWLDALNIPKTERETFKQAALLTHANEELLQFIEKKDSRIERLEKELTKLKASL